MSAVGEHLGQPRKSDGFDAVDGDPMIGRRFNLHARKASGKKAHQVVVLGATAANQHAARVGSIPMDGVLARPCGEFGEAGLNILGRQTRRYGGCAQAVI